MKAPVLSKIPGIGRLFKPDPLIHVLPAHVPKAPALTPDLRGKRIGKPVKVAETFPRRKALD